METISAVTDKRSKGPDQMFVSVVTNIPSDKTFTYIVPLEMAQSIAVGKRVLVPFGKRRVTAYIVGVMQTSPLEKLKEIIRILDDEPLFGEADLLFFRWASDYYLYPLGMTIHEILPSGTSQKSGIQVCLYVLHDSDRATLNPTQKAILELIEQAPAGVPVKRIYKMFTRKKAVAELKAMEKKGMIILQDHLSRPAVNAIKDKVFSFNASFAHISLTEKQLRLTEYIRSEGCVSMSILREKFANPSPVLKALEKKGVLSASEEDVFRSPDFSQPVTRTGEGIVLNQDQTAAVSEIAKAIDTKKYSPFLLHGVTGSGKTEVYLRAIEQVRKQGDSAIYLVPEIALTPQLIERVSSRFGVNDIAVIHSGISRPIRYDQWRQIQRGAITLVVGARSALFAPVKNLRLIIVDEEHDSSYKQDDRMRYNARDLSLVKAKQQSAVVILGSATPAVHTYYNAARKKYHYLILPSRVENRRLPHVSVVDMKTQQDEKGKTPVFSSCLGDALKETVGERKQALLFLNRRGYHTYIFCSDCGHVFKCPNCELSLTFHAGRSILKCHTCDYHTAKPSVCPSCRCERIVNYGAGTEKLEKEVAKLLPEARIARMDRDTTSRPGEYEKILDSLRRRNIDVLVGTQMITKGHDFPDITLVGIISADVGLNIPDFRAAERTFQLLTQVSGRGGRGDNPGRVIIQTFNPEHYAVVRAQKHDYDGFYTDELPLRKTLFYPPFSRIISLRISATDQRLGKQGAEKIGAAARELAGQLNSEDTIEIVGPAEAPIAKIKGRFRWQLLLKSQNSHLLHELARGVIERVHDTRLRIKVDVDPLNFM